MIGQAANQRRMTVIARHNRLLQNPETRCETLLKSYRYSLVTSRKLDTFEAVVKFVHLIAGDD